MRLPGSGLGEIQCPHLYPSPQKDVTDISTFEDSPPFSILSQMSTDTQKLRLSWYFYLAEIAMKRILKNLLIWQYNSRSEGEPSDQESRDRRLDRNVVEFERQILKWLALQSYHYPLVERSSEHFLGITCCQR